MLTFDTVRQYCQHFNNPTLHPLISMVDLNLSNEKMRTKFRMGFYAIVMKETRCGELRYGNQYYDYQEGTLVFFAPGQIVVSEPEGELHQPYGKALIFHADLIKGTPLGKQMHNYTFFSYTSREALHVSEKEKEAVQGCLDNIETEIRQNLDKHSKSLIVANLELLLKYCARFYDRQFITRESVHHGLVEQFEQLLIDYLSSEKLQIQGLPSVAYFADQLHLSSNYFGDLIKKETGKTALEYIQLQFMDLVKERIFDTSKSLSEISYELGFKYPQHFTRFFKQKAGMTPQQYRLLN